MYKAGDRIELVYTNDPYTKLKPGARGTVSMVIPRSEYVTWTQVMVDWDEGSNLTMIPEHGDRIQLVKEV